MAHNSACRGVVLDLTGHWSADEESAQTLKKAEKQFENVCDTRGQKVPKTVKNGLLFYEQAVIRICKAIPP